MIELEMPDRHGPANLLEPDLWRRFPNPTHEQAWFIVELSQSGRMLLKLDQQIRDGGADPETAVRHINATARFAILCGRLGMEQIKGSVAWGILGMFHETAAALLANLAGEGEA